MHPRTFRSANVCVPFYVNNFYMYAKFVLNSILCVPLCTAASCWLSSRAASTLPGLLDEKNELLPHRTILHSRYQEERWTVADLEVNIELQ